MMSAGHGYPPQTTGYQQHPGSPYGPGYGQGYGAGPQMQPPANFTPVTLPQQPIGPTGGPNMNINWTPEGKNGQKFMHGYMWGQFALQAGGMLNGMVNMLLNNSLARQAMNAQGKIALKYYDVQDKIAGYQMEVAIKQIGVQEQAIDAQRDMHREQCQHEERMAKLTGSVEVRKLAIEKNAEIKKAEIFSVTNPFGRRGWEMGVPAIAA